MVYGSSTLSFENRTKVQIIIVVDEGARGIRANVYERYNVLRLLVTLKTLPSLYSANV